MITSVSESHCSCIYFKAIHVHLSVHVKIVTGKLLSICLNSKGFFPHRLCLPSTFLNKRTQNSPDILKKIHLLHCNMLSHFMMMMPAMKHNPSRPACDITFSRELIFFVEWHFMIIIY